MQFRVKRGARLKFQGQIIKKGDVIESADPLNKMFPHRFECLMPSSVPLPASVSTAPEREREEGGSDDVLGFPNVDAPPAPEIPRKPARTPDGKDVSEKFKTPNGVQVYQKSWDFMVWVGGEEATDKPIKKAEVQDFLDELK